MPVTIGLGLSAATAIYGGIKQAQAEKAAKQNLANRPVYTPLPEDDSQLNLAESQANQGMGAGARQALLNNSQNNVAATNNAILMGGGDANAAAGAVDKSQKGLNNLAIYDDQARQAHIGTLLSTYNQYATQRQANADKQFQINKYAPWADKQQLYTQQQQAGQQLLSSGLSSLGKGLMSYNFGGDSSPDITMGRENSQIPRLGTSGPTQMPTPTPTPDILPYYPVPG